MRYPTLDHIDVKDKTVFVRVDYNVSLTHEGDIRDDSRIRASLLTLIELQKKGAKLVLASHLGHPVEGSHEMSLLPVGKKLAELLKTEVIVPDDCIGMAVKKLVSEMRSGGVILLENLRFHAEEKSCEENFSEKLASLADIYVNDAFGTMHRKHASTFGMVKYFETKAIGRLVEREVKALSRLLTEPERPFAVVLGGAKISDKIVVIESLLKKANQILIGGGMAYTFLKTQGVRVGRSLVEDTKVSLAKRILEKAKVKGVEVFLPVDSVIAEDFSAEAKHRVLKTSEDWGNGMALDLGPETVALYREILFQAKTVFWNGPMGVYEFPAFQKGTQDIAEAIVQAQGFSVIGGGDSLAAIRKSGVADKISHLSTGGGASLKFLEGDELPGLRVLRA